VIRDARVPAEIPVVRALFDEYAASLDVDLSFQDFARELAELPGEYAAPHGCLLLADDGGDIIGCVALRALAGGEDAVIARARVFGYRSVKLDTLASMRRARALYSSLGFRECAPYYRNPLPGTTYMELALD